jgi:hypothetical protein
VSISRPTNVNIQHTLLTAICACILAGILVAGLLPFHAPKNAISWLQSGNGLFFGKHGSVVSAGSFGSGGPTADGSCSLEVWLEPRRVRSSGTILAFYWPAKEVTPFALRQSVSDLKLDRGSQDRESRRTKIYVDDVFARLKPIFLTISAGATGTAIYADGVLVKKSTSFGLSSQDLTGQFIVGNAPSTTDSWSGTVKGIAIYGRELTPSEVKQHFADWTTRKQPEAATSTGLMARYLFDEGEGKVVHNQVDSVTDLVIPERFFVLHEEFLERPWDEFRNDWGYWQDVAINIGGFIPLGFFFCAYFSAVWKVKRAIWLTIVLGFAVSLTIEVLQSFLPTRDSGMTDLINNTLGTVLGAILCIWTIKHQWLDEQVRRLRIATNFPLLSSDDE